MAYLYYCYYGEVTMKDLGEYLKHTRISNGVSVAEAAEDLELSTSQLEKMVYGLKSKNEDE